MCTYSLKYLNIWFYFPFVSYTRRHRHTHCKWEKTLALILQLIYFCKPLSVLSTIISGKCRVYNVRILNHDCIKCKKIHVHLRWSVGIRFHKNWIIANRTRCSRDRTSSSLFWLMLNNVNHNAFLLLQAFKAKPVYSFIILPEFFFLHSE